MTREDPDMHQRFIADVETDRILGRWEASEDRGTTWRKDSTSPTSGPERRFRASLELAL
jgi:hypothetical protein